MLENSPINTLQQLMTISMEECGELTQRCSKIMRKYETLDLIEDDQRTKLLEEAGDVFCMLELMSEHGIFDWREIMDRADYKREKLKEKRKKVKFRGVLLPGAPNPKEFIL